MITAEEAKKLQKSYNIATSTLKEINSLVIDALKTAKTSVSIYLPGVSIFHVDEIINKLMELGYKIDRCTVYHGYDPAYRYPAYRYTRLTISWD